MKKSFLSLGQPLSRAEQNQIIGGSANNCAYYNGETGEVTCGLSSAQAQNSLANASDHWCCESCDSASWMVRVGEDGVVDIQCDL